VGKLVVVVFCHQGHQWGEQCFAIWDAMSGVHEPILHPLQGFDGNGALACDDA